MKKKDLKKIIKNLPKYPNVLGRNRFFKSAVLLPIVKIKGEYYLLFQKRAKHIKQGGDICFPGGRFEEKIDRDFKDTALRETYEELGIKKKDIKVLGQLDTFIAPIGAIIEPFVARVKRKAVENMKIDKNEVEKTILIPIKYFKNTEPKEYTLMNVVHPYIIDEDGNKQIHFPTQELGLPKRYQEPWGNRKHKVWVYQYEDEVIWGITAILINDFLEKY